MSFLPHRCYCATCLSELESQRESRPIQMQLSSKPFAGYANIVDYENPPPDNILASQGFPAKEGLGTQADRKWQSLSFLLFERAAVLHDIGPSADADMMRKAAGTLEGMQDRVRDLEKQTQEYMTHLGNFANSLGAKDGQDMLEILYGHFGRIRCECGHPADEHHMVEVAAEMQCGHTDTNYGYCECNGLRLCLYAEQLPPAYPSL